MGEERSSQEAGNGDGQELHERMVSRYYLGLRLPDGRLVTLQEFLDENPGLVPLSPPDAAK